jgi:hypothetical protein
METESITPGVAIAKESNFIGHVILIECKVLEGAPKFSDRMDLSTPQVTLKTIDNMEGIL